MKSFIVTIISLVLFILITIISLTPSIQKVSLTSLVSKLSLSVYDEDNKPINNATIYILETNEYHTTNHTGIASISLTYNTKNKILLKQNDKEWNEFTIITYKNGYLPHIVYGTKIQKGINRVGLIITLTSLENANSKTYTSSYDFPPSSYTEHIISSNKPK